MILLQNFRQMKNTYQVPLDFPLDFYNLQRFRDATWSKQSDAWTIIGANIYPADKKQIDRRIPRFIIASIYDTSTCKYILFTKLPRELAARFWHARHSTKGNVNIILRVTSVIVSAARICEIVSPPSLQKYIDSHAEDSAGGATAFTRSRPLTQGEWIRKLWSSIWARELR